MLVSETHKKLAMSNNSNEGCFAGKVLNTTKLATHIAILSIIRSAKNIEDGKYFEYRTDIDLGFLYKCRKKYQINNQKREILKL